MMLELVCKEGPILVFLLAKDIATQYQRQKEVKSKKWVGQYLVESLVGLAILKLITESWVAYKKGKGDW